jgi:hypothetical protein
MKDFRRFQRCPEFRAPLGLSKRDDTPDYVLAAVAMLDQEREIVQRGSDDERREWFKGPGVDTYRGR